MCEETLHNEAAVIFTLLSKAMVYINPLVHVFTHTFSPLINLIIPPFPKKKSFSVKHLIKTVSILNATILGNNTMASSRATTMSEFENNVPFCLSCAPSRSQARAWFHSGRYQPATKSQKEAAGDNRVQASSVIFFPRSNACWVSMKSQFVDSYEGK